MDELYHYGIKGMKWGVRRTPEQLGYKRGKRRDAGGQSDRSDSAKSKAKGASKSSGKRIGYGELRDKLKRGEISQREYDEIFLRGRFDAKAGPDDERRYLQDYDWDKINAGDRNLLAKVQAGAKDEHGTELLGSTRNKLTQPLYDEAYNAPYSTLDKNGYEGWKKSFDQAYAVKDDAWRRDRDILKYDIPYHVSQKEYDAARRCLGEQGARDYYTELARVKPDGTKVSSEEAYDKVSKGQKAYEEIVTKDLRQESNAHKFEGKPYPSYGYQNGWPWDNEANRDDKNQSWDRYGKHRVNTDFQEPDREVWQKPPADVKKNYKTLSWGDARKMMREGKMTDEEFEERKLLGKINVPKKWFYGDDKESKDYWEYYREKKGIKEKTPEEWKKGPDFLKNRDDASAGMVDFTRKSNKKDGYATVVNTSRVKAVERMVDENERLMKSGRPPKYDPGRLKQLVDTVYSQNKDRARSLFRYTDQDHFARAKKLLGYRGALDFFMETDSHPFYRNSDKEDIYWHIKAGQKHFDELLQKELEKAVGGAHGYEMKHRP